MPVQPVASPIVFRNPIVNQPSVQAEQTALREQDIFEGPHTPSQAGGDKLIKQLIIRLKEMNQGSLILEPDAFEKLKAQFSFWDRKTLNAIKKLGATPSRRYRVYEMPI